MHVARKLIGKALGTAGGTPSRSHVGISLEDVEGELESSMNQATQARSRLALARSRHEQSVLEHVSPCGRDRHLIPLVGS